MRPVGEEDDHWPILERGAGYVIEARPEGPSLDCVGCWTGEASEVLSSGRVNGLTLSYTSGFSESSLDFIEPWPIQSLMLIDRSMGGIHQLERLGQLESLFVQAGDRATLDISAFSRLSQLGTYWSHVEDSVTNVAPTLRDLTVWTLRTADLVPLEPIQRLQTLEIITARALKTLDGIEGSQLREIRIAGAPRLSDISAIAVLPELTNVTFEGCRSITSIGSLARASDKIRELWLDDCGEVESLRPIEYLTGLETVVLSGDTNIVDGDLDPLNRLPSLRTLRMTKKRHYNIDPASIAPS